MRATPEPSLIRFRDAYAGFSDSLSDIRHLSANKVTDEPLTQDDLDKHRAFLDEVNARIDRDHLTMEKIMKDSQGRWDDAFYELMLDLADEIYDEKGYANRPKDHKALITGGLGGSGKSTTLEKLKDLKAIDSLGDWITINPDDMKEEMVARGIFPTIEGVSTAEMANIMHGVSAELAHLLGERALSEGHNVIFDVTMGGGVAKQPDGSVGSRANEIVSDLQRSGYADIHGLFMDISVQNSIDNAMARHERGLVDLRAGRSTEGGRYVPEKIIRHNTYAPGPGERGSPNPISYGLSKNVNGKKVITPYEDRYGTNPQQRMLAASAENLRAAIFAATPENAAAVDQQLAQFTNMQKVVTSGGRRAVEELEILTAEWEFLDPRTSGVSPADRFKSVNAYNFEKAVAQSAFSEWAKFDNADLGNQIITDSTGKYEGLKLPPRRTSSHPASGPMMEGLTGSGDYDFVAEIMTGLESGTHELASIPTSDADGAYRLHVPMAHSDEAEFSQYIEYKTPEARDKALAQARELQEESFAKRAEKISALETPGGEIEELTNGLVDIPESDGTYIGNLRGRMRLRKRLEEVKLPEGGWGLRDTASGALVGESGSRQDIAARKEQILNRLYPRLGS